MIDKSKTSIANSLSEYGQTFETKLIRAFIMREGFYPTINSVIDPNLFEDIRLRTVVGMIKDYYEQYGAVPSFRTAEMLIQSSNTLDPITKEEVVAALNRCKEETSEAESEVVKRARYFFSRQKALILFNEGQRKLIGNNSLEALSSTFSKLQQVMDAAHGSEPVQKSQYNVEELFSPHSRGPVPTGVKKLDEILEGGLGKGEIGLIIGGSGFGKVQPNDSNVATPYGFMKMGELELGDTILGKNGKPIKVVGIFPHNEWEFYRVTFNDDTYTECGLEHLWNVNTLEREKNGEPYITCSLREIMNTGQVDKFFIPVCDCIEYPERDLQMDPYDMGLMLGIAAEHRKRNIDYNNINLDDYYYNTKENRVKFLNGILDVIGYLNANTGLPYIPVVYRDEIYPIVRKVVESLGCLVSFPEDDDTEMRLVLFEGCDFKPFYAEEWLNDHIKYKKKEEYHRFITEVEYSRTTDGRCIKVDAEDELYLTDDYIVTHNTSMLTSIACYNALYKSEENDYKGNKVLYIFFEDKTTTLQKKHVAYLTNIEAKDLVLGKDLCNKAMEIVKTDEYKEKCQMLSDNLFLRVGTIGDFSVNTLESLLNSERNQGREYNLVLLDYFECIRLLGDSSESKYDKETNNARKLSYIAKKFDIPIWYASQSNRGGVKAAKNKEMSTEDVSGSYGKVQVSDICLLIQKDNEDKKNNFATINIEKNRSGSAGVQFRAYFNNGTCHIDSDAMKYGDAFQMETGDLPFGPNKGNNYNLMGGGQVYRNEQVKSIAKNARR